MLNRIAAELVQRFPLLRIAGFLVIGICLGRLLTELGNNEFLIAHFACFHFVSGALLLTTLAGACCAGYKQSNAKSLTEGLVFGLFIALFFLFFGFWSYVFTWRGIVCRWPDKPDVYEVVLTDVPKVRARSMTCEAIISDTLAGSTAFKHKYILLTLYKDSLSRKLKVGDRILFRAKIKEPVNKGNPEEFDYAGYLLNQGISGLVFPESSQWLRVEEGRSRKLGDIPWKVKTRIRALQFRELLLEEYRRTGLRGEVLALYSAVTLGHRASMPDELKEIYSVVGVNHILALSGMHLGVLVALLHYFLLRRLYRRRVYILGVASTLVLVWIYGLLTGLQPSLVRAALMYSLMLLGTLWGRKGFSLNALVTCAWLMLCAHPFLLYDVGFQLSFLAMCGILVVYPQLISPSFLKVKYFGGLIKSLALSFSAQLFTVPAVAYYFHVITPYSGLVTLALSPLTAIFMGSMPLLLLVTGCLPLASGLAMGITWLVQLQHAGLRIVAEWPFASLGIHPSPVWLLLTYLGIATVLMKGMMNYARWLKWCLIWMISIGGAFLFDWNNKQKAPCLIFYNIPRCPMVHVIETDKRSYLLAAKPDSLRSCTTYIASSFWARKLSASPLLLSHSFRDAHVSVSGSRLDWQNRLSLVMLSGAYSVGSEDNACPMPLDYLYVCRGFYGSLKEMSAYLHPSCVVLDASLSESNRLNYLRECEEMQWAVHDIQTQGALKVALK